MIATPINAFASLDTKKLEDSVNQCVVVIKLILMENVFATMEKNSSMENVLVSTDAHWTVIMIIQVDAALATVDSLSSMVNAAAINTVDWMDILDMVNATARKDSIGFLDHANHVELIKLSMVLSVNALLATLEMWMETVWNQTLFPTVIRMKDSTQPFKLVSVLKVPNTWKEHAKSFQHALEIHTTMVLIVSVKLDLHYKTVSVLNPT